ncbi:MAG: hypothetical protein ACYTHM_02395 [Planctomycetota bacterium]|jgi:hypothetical protein
MKAKKPYTAPDVDSAKVLERAALTCSGYFTNNLYNNKSNSYSCGFNHS